MFYKPIAMHGKLDKYGKLTKKGQQVVLFQKYDGFALPIEVLRRIKCVEIHHNGIVYLASVQDFRNHGFEHDFKDEKQYILPRKYWKITNQTELF